MSVSMSLVQEIAAAARENGAEPIGIFVDESAVRGCTNLSRRVQVRECIEFMLHHSHPLRT